MIPMTMFDNEILGSRYGIVFVVAGLAFLAIAPISLLAGGLALVRKQKGKGLRFLVAAPVLLALAFLMLETGCVRRTVVADLSSPRNTFRARSVIRNSGGAGSFLRIVEVARPGLVGWTWAAVLTTSSPATIQIEWRDDTTLVLRARLQPPPPLAPFDGVSLVFESCDASTEPPLSPFVNRC
jgi:hypothetical protein